jgi:2-phospho-L-lactate guanylyltransferase
VNGVWAAVPVKGFANAKQRLAGVLTPAQRAALAAAMLEDVLEALAAAPLAGILVNTPDPQAAALARAWGAEVIADDAASGHTGAVAAMARWLIAVGRPAMLALPGDLPRVTAAEIAALCAAAPAAPSFTIAPARDERGSNAVLLAPPAAVPLRFGDDSFFPHLDAARRVGIDPVVVALPGIGLDIDTPEDLRELRQPVITRPGRAERLLRSFSG